MSAAMNQLVMNTRTPMRAMHRVVYEVRPMGSKDGFDPGVFVVDAFTLSGAMDCARAEAHCAGYETRYPLSVSRVQQ